MKNQFLISSVSVILLLIISCSQGDPLTSAKIADNPFSKDVGGFIAHDTVVAWIGNYRKANPTAVQAHFISSSLIQKILQQEDCNGITFKYGMDEHGEAKLVLVGVKNGKSITTLAVNTSSSARVDKEPGGQIDYSTALAWSSSYVNENPNKIRSHFFGSLIIQEIMRETDCIGISMRYALDNHGTRQIILTGIDSNGELIIAGVGNNVRTKEGGGEADISMPCPDACSEPFI